MKRNKIVLTLTLVMALLLTVVGAPMLSKRADAAAIVDAYMLIDDIAAGRTSGARYIFAIQPLSTFTSPTITVTFPVADDTEWCRTAGALASADVTSSVADAGGFAITTGLAGTQTVACTQGNGSSTYDTITFSSVGAMSTSDTYGFDVTGATGALGTSTNGIHYVTITITEGATVDVITFGVQLLTNPDVVVTADVEAPPSVTCSVDDNDVDLGVLYAGGAFATATHTISATTTASAGGYYWAVYGYGDNSSDAGLYSTTGTYLIPSTGNTTVNLNTTEGFGMTVTAASGATVPSDFATGTLGQFGALDRGFAGAQMLTYETAAETGGATPTVTYGAKAGLSASAQTDYQETVTFICGGYY